MHLYNYTFDNNHKLIIELYPDQRVYLLLRNIYPMLTNFNHNLIVKPFNFLLSTTLNDKLLLKEIYPILLINFKFNTLNDADM